MNSNNLDNIKRNIRNLAKKCRGISYSTALVVLFAMLGTNAFSEEISSTVPAKQEIGKSTDRLSKVLREIKTENDKKLKGVQLELVQLMEQGNQVVKSPWSSWQFGINYFYSNWRGSYKGIGDKKEKYPYEGKFKRDAWWEGAVSPESPVYERIAVKSDPKSATSSNRKGFE